MMYHTLKFLVALANVYTQRPSGRALMLIWVDPDVFCQYLRHPLLGFSNADASGVCLIKVLLAFCRSNP